MGRYKASAPSGVISTSGNTNVGMSDMVPCDANTAYTATLFNVPESVTMYLFWYDSLKQYISHDSKGATNAITYSSPANAEYLYVFCYKGGSGITIDSNSKMQVEKGSTSTEYVELISAEDKNARNDIETMQTTLDQLTELDLPTLIGDQTSEYEEIASWTVNSGSHNFDTLKAGLYLIDCTTLVNAGYIMARIIKTSGSPVTDARVVYEGKTGFFYTPDDLYRVYVVVKNYNEQNTSGSVKLYRINNTFALKEPIITNERKKFGVVDITAFDKQLNKGFSGGGAVNVTGRVAIGLIEYTGQFTISLTDYTNYKFAVIMYNDNDVTYVACDGGWITSGSLNINISDGTVFGITLARTSGNITSLAEVISSGLSIVSTDGYYEKNVTRSQINSLNASVKQALDGARDINALKTTETRMLFNKDGLFFNHIGASYLNDSIIQSQSIADIERTFRLGFSAIELNPQQTSDGHYIVTHGVSGAFGNQFYSLDNTDISNVQISSKTLAWIQANVRYNSALLKYRTAPPTLEEALSACKKFGIVPYIGYFDGLIDIADAIMGKQNYALLVYSADRPEGFYGKCFSWITPATTTEALAKCELSGGAYVAGINHANSAYSSYTEADWKAFAESLHSNGYNVGSAYVSNPIIFGMLHRAGFDNFASSYHVNDFQIGNVCDLDSGSDFSEFTTTGTVENGILTLDSTETITPSTTLQSVFLGKGSLHITFDGEIKIVMGKYINNAYTLSSDGTQDIWLSTYFENASPTFTITASETTTVSKLTYKASKC